MTIYTVTGIYAEEIKLSAKTTKLFPKARTFGWVSGLNEAKHIVANNIGDINEAGYYEYAVVEGWPKGMNTVCSTEVWFKWEGGPEGAYKPCAKPDFVSDIVHFAIG